MQERLIFDIGMHTGKDTEFYLRKGFRVIAIEANPILVRTAQERLTSYIESDMLVVLNLAIADHDGETEFFVNAQRSYWGTRNPGFIHRNLLRGTDHYPIKVKCARFEKILQDHGVPYYLKIDIEGDDLLCLEGLSAHTKRPRYVSIETAMKDDDQVFTELSQLWLLGYRMFKIIDQSQNHRTRCPYPAREGDYVATQFDGEMSGPFGEETPGAWLNIDQTLRRARWLSWEQRLYGKEGERYQTRQGRLYRRFMRKVRGVSVDRSWYDFHARLGEDSAANRS